ncbi:ATP-binding cassette domain-containing protein, partial [Vagococcus salmoninarum]
METILSLNNVSKTFKQQQALSNVTMSIKKGDIYGLIGRNGAGKTTLLKTITRLSKQTSGEIQLFNSQNNQELT